MNTNFHTIILHIYYNKKCIILFIYTALLRIIHSIASIIRAINHATDRATDDLREVDIEKQITMLILENSSISITELAEKTKKHRATIFRYINSLKKKKILKRIGTTRNGEWKVINKI